MIEFVAIREELREKYSSITSSITSSMIPHEYRVDGKYISVNHASSVDQKIAESALRCMFENGCFNEGWTIWGIGSMLHPPTKVKIYELEEEEEEESDFESILPEIKGPRYRAILTAKCADLYCPDTLEFYISFHLDVDGCLVDVDGETFDVYGSQWL